MSAPGPVRAAENTRNDWETPWPLFRALDREFRFTLDAAASVSNRKCERYLTVEENALVADVFDQVVWCNPPYGRGLEAWVKAFARWSTIGGCTVVALLPDAIETKWFASVWFWSHEIRLLHGRVQFGEKGGNPCGSIVAVYRPQPPSVPAGVVIAKGDWLRLEIEGTLPSPPRVSLWDWRAE